jgi:hypothetical protein
MESPAGVLQKIESIIAEAKATDCCSVNDQGYIQCGIDCRGRCCIDGPKFCRDPCEKSVKWNEELKALYATLNL